MDNYNMCWMHQAHNDICGSVINSPPNHIPNSHTIVGDQPWQVSNHYSHVQELIEILADKVRTKYNLQSDEEIAEWIFTKLELLHDIQMNSASIFDKLENGTK